MIGWARDRAADPRAGRWAVALGCALAVPTLFGGLQVDDHWHGLVLRGDPRWPEVQRPFWDAFQFVDGNRVHTQHLIELGGLPWWTNLDTKLRFFRPLSSATHALDHALFHGAPALMHLHSLLWFAALLTVASALLRRLLLPVSATAAGLAALFYAVSCSRGSTVGWIAQRNSLIAGTLALSALLFHVRGAERSRRADPVIAAALFGLGLLGGESALCVLGLLVAYALLLDPRPRPLRFLAPYFVLAGAWAFTYRTLGYGAQGSALYVDPLRSPARFARQALIHLPLLLGTELGGPLPDLHPVLPLALRVALLLGACVAIGFTLAAMSDRRDRFFLLGATLAAVPVCATEPSGRLMTIVGLPLVALQARLVSTYLLDGAPRARALRLWARWVVGLRLVLGPALFMVTAWQFWLLEHGLRRLAQSVPDDLARGSALYLVNGPGFLSAYTPILRRTTGLPMPPAFAAFANGTRPLTVRRTGPRTLELTVERGVFAESFEQLTNDPDRPYEVGQRIVLPDVTLELAHVTAAGIPDVVTLTFASDLASPTRGFLTWQGRTFVRWRVPALGETVSLPPAVQL